MRPPEDLGVLVLTNSRWADDLAGKGIQWNIGVRGVEGLQDPSTKKIYMTFKCYKKNEWNEKLTNPPRKKD